MRTLLNEFNGERWYPHSISIYKDTIQIDLNVADSKVTLSNIAYNLQYLEFIEKELLDLKLSSVIEKMLLKTYIITAMGIIESLFANILKSNRLWRVSEWKSVAILKSSEKKIDNGKTIMEITEIFEKVGKHDERMDFDSMIKKVEKRNLLKIDHNVFPALKILRELRNKVHLQNRNEFPESDFNSFNMSNKKMMGRVLYTILTSDELCNEKNIEIYDFFMVNFDKE